MAAASFELPNGFVNHGAMACEALAVLDCVDDIGSWARRFAQAGGVESNWWRLPALSGGKPSGRTTVSRSGSGTSRGPLMTRDGRAWSRRGCRG
jgi:hypothetical protein